MPVPIAPALILTRIKLIADMVTVIERVIRATIWPPIKGSSADCSRWIKPNRMWSCCPGSPCTRSPDYDGFSHIIPTIKCRHDAYTNRETPPNGITILTTSWPTRSVHRHRRCRCHRDMERARIIPRMLSLSGCENVEGVTHSCHR